MNKILATSVAALLAATGTAQAEWPVDRPIELIVAYAPGGGTDIMLRTLAPYLEDVEILIPPFIVGDFLEVVFVRKHGMVFEYMRYLKDGWFGK